MADTNIIFVKIMKGDKLILIKQDKTLSYKQCDFNSREANIILISSITVIDNNNIAVTFRHVCLPIFT